MSSLGDYGMQPVAIHHIDIMESGDQPSLLDRIKSKVPEIKEKLNLGRQEQQSGTLGMESRYSRKENYQMPGFGQSESALSRGFESYQPETRYQDFSRQREGYTNYHTSENVLRQSSEMRTRELRRENQPTGSNDKASAKMFAGMLYSEG